MVHECLAPPIAAAKFNGKAQPFLEKAVMLELRREFNERHKTMVRLVGALRQPARFAGPYHLPRSSSQGTRSFIKACHSIGA
jgi:hypothetical protein